MTQSSFIERSRRSFASLLMAAPLALGLTECSSGTKSVSTTEPTSPVTVIADTDKVSVPTYHYDSARSGIQSQETSLTPANVNTATFGKLFSVSVDAAVYAQPLIATNVNMINNDGQPHTLLLVATENDTVYAFDADNASTAPFWKVSLLGSGEQPVPYGVTGATGVGPAVGITGTPVLDLTQGILYVVAKSTGSGTYYQRLHALNLQTGAEALNGPTLITASVPGGASDAVNGSLTFNALRQHQRAALALNNGTVWITWASHSDTPPYHGWLLGYKSTDISQQTYIFNDTPNGPDGGIWMSAGGPSFDSSGNLFLNTGNGDFNDSSTVSDFSSSALKLVPGNGPNGTMTVADYFAPFNQASLSAVDADFGIGSSVLLPDASGNTQHPHLLITLDKSSTAFLIDRDNMGKYNSITNNVLQQFASSTNHIKQNPLFFNNTLYVSGDSAPMFAYPFNPSSGQFQTSPSSASTEVFSCSGCYTGGSSPTISENGTSNAVLWTIDNGALVVPGPAILRAYNPANLAQELYDSTQAASNRDQAPNAVTFTTPVVANGKVYVGGDSSVSVYGLLAH